jgi:hypothetical protein
MESGPVALSLKSRDTGAYASNWIPIVLISRLHPSSTMSASDLSELTAARYGKGKVRVFRIVRQGSWHHVVEYNVEALLEGEISTR